MTLHAGDEVQVLYEGDPMCACSHAFNILGQGPKFFKELILSMHKPCEPGPVFLC